MSSLFAIPLLSVALAPSLFASYATSLNFVFFYMTWSTLVLSHPPLRVILAGTVIARLIFFVIPSLLFFLADTLLPSIAVSFKAQGEAGLPSGRKSGYVRVKDIKVVAWTLFNVLLGIFLQFFIEWFVTRTFGARYALSVSMRIPMPWDIVVDLTRGYILREILTYVLHRYILHSNSILTKWHGSWYHGVRAPYALIAHYDHPAAYIIWRFIPTYTPALFFRFHMLTYLLYLSLVSLEETFAFSGYTTLPTSFLLGGIARRTDEHLLSGGDGNYGPSGVVDWCCGTSIGDTDIQDDVVEELEDHEVEEMARRFKSKINDKLNGRIAGGNSDSRGSSGSRSRPNPRKLRSG